MNSSEQYADEPCDPRAEAQHHLGTELGVIFACCYKLRQSTERPMSSDAVALLQKIQRSAESIRDLRGLLIDFTRD